MKARSFSHVGITVSDFNRFVQFYWDVFGCPLVGVSDTPPDRVRSFFKVDGPQPACKIGWVRVPGGAILEIFEFQPQLRPDALQLQRPEHAEVVRLSRQQGRRVPGQARAVTSRAHVLLCAGLRRQPDRDDRSRLHALRAAVARAARGIHLSSRDVQAVLRPAVGTSSAQNCPQKPLTAESAEFAEKPTSLALRALRTLR